MFKLFPRLDVVGRLPLLDLLGDRGQFAPQLLARVLLDERVDLLEKQSRIVSVAVLLSQSQGVIINTRPN